MRTKNIILTTLVTLMSVVLLAQVTPKQKSADKLFKNYSYSKAIEKYLSIADKDITVKRNLAESYYHLSEFVKSEEWSKTVINTTGFSPDDVYRYAYILRINQKYPASESWMNTYYELNGGDS